MKNEIPNDLAESVNGTIEKYGLIQGNVIAVALSGGKDSLLLCMTLRQLGFDVTPLVIDMGYEIGWADRISNLAECLGFGAKVIPIRSLGKRRLLSGERTRRLELNLTVLDDLTTDTDDARVTPCTSCYNSKVLALEGELNRVGIDRIAFGHHATDACASLVKAALMYIDRWDIGNERYSPTHFRTLVRMLVDDINRSTPHRATDKSIVSRIASLVEENLATTDEPPRQALISGSATEIVRPLFDMQEVRLLEIASSLSLRVEGSGCGHSATAASYTAREIVHFEALRNLELQKKSALIREWTQHALDNFGRLTVNARRRRDELLGPNYKPSAQHLHKY